MRKRGELDCHKWEGAGGLKSASCFERGVDGIIYARQDTVL